MIYIIELDTPLGNSRHTARFYIGYAENVEARMWYHLQGRGSAFTRAAVERGISFKIIITLPGDKTYERQLKNRKSTPRLVKSIYNSPERYSATIH